MRYWSQVSDILQLEEITKFLSEGDLAEVTLMKYVQHSLLNSTLFMDYKEY